MELDPLVVTYIENHPASAAGSLSQLRSQELADLLLLMQPQSAAVLLSHMRHSSSADALTRLENDEAATILGKMPNEVAVLTLRAIDRAKHGALYRAMPRHVAIRLRMQMRYPEALIGSLMDMDAVTLKPEMRVSDALRLLRVGNKRVTQQLYLVDEQRRLSGYVNLATLIVNRERTLISRFQQPAPMVLNARAPLHTAEDLDVWLTFDSLPVVDRRGSFQGVLRRDAVNRAEQPALGKISVEKEYTKTRSALADLFWLVLGSLLAPRQASSVIKKER